MGSSCPVTIHFTSKLKSCFVNVSTLLEREWNSIWKDVSVVKGIRLVCEDKSIYTSWSGHTYISSQDSHAIQISRKFGEGLGLKDGQEVVATPLGNVASCTHATFLPTSKSDWEIAESNSNVIESNLTNQLRIIWEGAILPIWIQKNNCLVVTVGEIYPQTSYAQIEEFTELKLVPWEQVQSTKDKPSEELTPTDQNCVESSSVSTASSSPSDISTDGNKSDSTSSSQSTSSSRVRNSFNLSFGRSLNEVGDKYEQTYTPTYPVDISNSLPGFRGGVVNLMKAVVYGTHSAEVGNSEKSLKYPTTNKSYFQGGKVSNTSVMRGKKSSSTLFSGIPMDSYYRVQDLLVPSNDVATPHMKRGRTQLLPRKLFEQPSTVFVYCAALTCFVNRLLNDKVPIADDVLISNKYAVVTVSIHKMYSVKERFDVNSSGKRADTGSNDNTPTDDLKESDPVKLFERKRFESSMNSKQRNVSSGERGSFASLPATTVRLVLTNQRNFYVDEDSKDCLLLGEELVPGHVAVNGLLRRQLKLGIKSTIQIKRVFHKPSFLMGIVLNPFGDSARKIKSFSKNEVSYAFRIWILDTTKEYPLVLSSRMLIAFNLSPDVKCEFLLSGIGTDSPNSNPSNMQYYFVSQETLKDVNITVGEVIQPSYYLLLSPYPPKNTLMLDQELPKCRISSLGGFDQIYKTCFDFLLHGLSCQPLSQELSRSGKLGCHALLLHGSGSTAGGSGKSSLARALCNQLGRHPILAYVSIIECISLRGKRVETIRQSWQQVFSNSAWHQPAVVLFDDLDQLIAAPSLLQEHGPEAHYSLRLAEVFKDLLRKEATYNSQLVVIATVTSRDSVHPSLLTSHGNHVFNKTVEVPLPGLNERALMINSILRRKEMCLPSEDVRFIAVKTEGCSPKDLNTLVARAFQVTTMRRNRSKQDLDSLTISLHDFREALKNFKPASLHGIKLHQAVDLGWRDVGGLEEVKRTLRETLEWPVKFPKLYTNIPMRLPSGILLYGPPGTGKTLLAGVVAKECSLNFISIKGPELLNKYIGASEQAVRDLFHRAQSAKPCILFFDEFDSMAPSRGHDSTGVTDRVVNQLLTQLDGVEGLEGVYILGATSRPDLIDPALLRPGRLDKSLYCGMPDEKDRLDILKALSSKLNLHDDVDLEGIARETVNFSGADLKALLSNAQLESIHEVTSTIPGKSDKAKRSSNIVCMPQLKDGPRELPVEENKELQKQVGVLEENFFKHLSGKANDSPQPDMSHTVTIKHSNIMKSLSNMGPSVSSEERIKYASIYNSFMKSRKTASPQMSVIKQRATLA